MINPNFRTLTIVLIVSLLFITACSFGPSTEVKTKFANCLSDKEVTMFGAYWCPHCQQQKKMFGDAWDEINYVECSLPGGQGQTEICIQAGIQSYPTWEFAPGDRISGALTFEQLAAKSGCQINFE